MDSARRDWYLSALGVVRYVPRDSHSADGGERAYAQPAEASPPAAVQPAAVPRAAATGAPETRLDIPAGQPARKPPAIRAQSAATESEPLQFRLAFWQPSNSLVVLSAMPPGARPGAAQQDMLANLLAAIRQLDGPLPALDLLEWPVARGRDTSLDGARQLLATFLDVKHKLKPFQWVLLMGEIAARVAATDNVPDVGGQVALSCGARGIRTHSLLDMERDKSLKRDTWEAIRFLAEESA